jgi:gamma-glutamyltranspeptidase / glutathione hydrolase
LAVTYPAAGNIGGGGFMVVRLASGKATTFDFREKAPLKSTETMFQHADGSIAHARTDSGWLSPGVPGTVRGLALAHTRLGRLPWRDLVRPAADLASRGYAISASFADELNWAVGDFMKPFPSSVAAYGKPGGGKWEMGDTLRLTDLARALDAIATRGADAFYTGWIADSLDAAMRAHGGIITKRDLAAYRAIERLPVRGTFLGHEIIGMAPPSSGGTVMIETLNQLEGFGIDRMSRWSPEFLHLRIEAARRAYLDRARWLGDPDFVRVPVARLTSKAYARELAGSIDTARASQSVSLGGDIVNPVAEPNETTHFSVVDRDGNAVAVTYTLEGGYGSGVVVPGAGFLLNNEMGDFNKKAGATNVRGGIGTPANLIAPGKRMLSSMSPTIVTKGGKLRLVTGSPGGRTIPNTVLDVVLGVTAFRMGIRDAVDAPRLHHQWLPDSTWIEGGPEVPAATIAVLVAKGHSVRTVPVRSQGDAHSILYDAPTKTAYGANDRRSPDSKASVPAPPAVPR